MTLRIVPLGGLGEIGMNCLAIEQPDGILVVDAGITFPHQDLGVDVYHPDFSWLDQHADRVVGVFLTHGHEDHVGALPYQGLIIAQGAYVYLFMLELSHLIQNLFFSSTRISETDVMLVVLGLIEWVGLVVSRGPVR